MYILCVQMFCACATEYDTLSARKIQSTSWRSTSRGTHVGPLCRQRMTIDAAPPILCILLCFAPLRIAIVLLALPIGYATIAVSTGNASLGQQTSMFQCFFFSVLAHHRGMRNELHGPGNAAPGVSAACRRDASSALAASMAQLSMAASTASTRRVVARALQILSYTTALSAWKKRWG